MEADLARELKVFRKQFRKDHGRDPSRKDMNKHPGIAATYDSWLAIKSTQSASTSTASATNGAKGSKRKTLPDSPHKTSNGEGSITTMGPPPTTPSKKKKRVTYSNSFLTPTKNRNASPSGQSVHDSGGSVIDVPLTPKQNIGSPSLSRKHHQPQKNFETTIPSSPGRTYEDGSSPSKLRALLSSFSSIHRTPTKRKGEEDKNVDAALMEKLTRGGAMPAYTPRTKARKRLRGEVVITPEKARAEKQKSNDSATAREDGQQLPLRKKRRGMGMTTLKDFGIVPIVGPRSKEAGSQMSNGDKREQTMRIEKNPMETSDEELSDDDDDDDDIMLGPSPSVNRTVDRKVKSFKPLFGVEANGTFSEDEGSVGMDDNEEGVGKEGDDINQPEILLNDTGKPEDSDEDDDLVVVPYQRYKQSKFSIRRNGELQNSAADEEDADDDDMGFYNFAASVRQASPTDATNNIEGALYHSEEEDEGHILESLSLNSPQCKKARNSMRIKAEREIRQLLGTEEEIQPIDWEKEDSKSESNQPKTNKVGPPIKGGKLRKGFKDVKPTISSNNKTKETGQRASSSKSLIFQNSRDQIGSDQDSDFDQQGNDDDDEWASDVDSAEYGLGNGYMSDDFDVL